MIRRRGKGGKTQNTQGGNLQNKLESTEHGHRENAPAMRSKRQGIHQRHKRKTEHTEPQYRTNYEGATDSENIYESSPV